MLKIVFLLVMLATVTISAQEAPVATEADAGKVEKTEEKPVAQDVEEKAPETFNPTEEVSEDYSIEFPVNI